MLVMGVLRMGRWRREMRLGVMYKKFMAHKSLKKARIYHIDSGVNYQQSGMPVDLLARPAHSLSEVCL